jgi:hypothetical protein
MKIALQYLNDTNGNTTSVQLPLSDWEKLMHTLRKYEQAMKMKTTLADAYKEVERLKKSKQKKQTLAEFLHEL